MGSVGAGASMRNLHRALPDLIAKLLFRWGHDFLLATRLMEASSADGAKAFAN
jgi:hypothetical protein